MPTKRIGDAPRHDVCTHPEHTPPAHRYFAPGVYEHTCPSCGCVTIFVIPHDEMFRVRSDPDVADKED